MPRQEKIDVISLGGKEEVGNNMIILESNDEILILDAGVLFPEEDNYGVDLIIPDISYLIEKKDKIKGIIFSHGHEDHIGAIPFILKMINPPLYGTDFTMALVKNKLTEAGLIDKANLNIIGSNHNYTSLSFDTFNVEFCHVNHSIPASVAMAIETPIGLIVYTGDYKFDQTPLFSPQTEYHKLADWARKDVLALLGDSTNAENKGHTLSERVVAQNLEESFQLVQQRIILATFSSNINRIQQVINAGKKIKRKLALAGTSMMKTVEIASDLGYLKIPSQMLITVEEANKLNPEKVIILLTGSQGEYNAALTRMARGEHRELEIIPGDTVYLSASAIPGNEKAISNTINRLYKRGAKVIYNDLLDVHASGHACQEEIKMMTNIIKPQYLVPVHGEFSHLFHHARMGKQMGLPVGNIFITENGDRLELTPEQGKIKGKVDSGKTYIEGYQISITGNRVLNDRQKLATNGYLNVIITVNKENTILSEPQLVTRGFVHNRERKKLLNQAQNQIKDTFIKITKDKNKNMGQVKRKIYDMLKDFFYQELNRFPVIAITIIKLDEE